MISISDNRHVVWDRKNGLKILLDKFIPPGLIVVLHADCPAKTDLFCIFISADLKRIPVL